MGVPDILVTNAQSFNPPNPLFKNLITFPNKTHTHIYRAYHWPGFETGERYDEPGMMALMRRYGARAQGQSEAAPLPVPAAPAILGVSQLGEVTFRYAPFVAAGSSLRPP